MGRSFWAQKGYLALAPGPLALALARPILGTRTNEKLPHGSFSFVSGPGFQQGWVLIKPSLMSGAWKAPAGSSWLFLAPGSSLPLLAPPGSCWLFLASPSSSCLLPASLS